MTRAGDCGPGHAYPSWGGGRIGQAAGRSNRPCRRGPLLRRSNPLARSRAVPVGFSALTGRSQSAAPRLHPRHHEVAPPGREHRGRCSRTDSRRSSRDRHHGFEDHGARGALSREAGTTDGSLSGDEAIRPEAGEVEEPINEPILASPPPVNLRVNPTSFSTACVMVPPRQTWPSGSQRSAECPRQRKSAECLGL